MFAYPDAPSDGTAEALHGTAVADPYRPLEAPDDPATVEWTAEQNALAEPYLAGLPGRAWFAERLEALHGAAVAGVPWWRGGRYLRTVRPAGREQESLLVADSLAELQAGGRVLVDPEEFGEPGTVSLSACAVSPDGELLAYALSFSGSDWRTVRVRSVTSGRDTADRINRSKFHQPVWLPDASGFLYWGYPDASGTAGDGREARALGAGALLLHRLGTPQGEDTVLWCTPRCPRDMVTPMFSEDGRWLLLTVREGTASETRLHAHRVRRAADGAASFGPRFAVFDAATDRREPVGTHGDTLYLVTDEDAPSGRLASADLAAFERGERPPLRTVVPEQRHALQSAAAGGAGFLLAHLVDAAHRVTWYGRDGTAGYTRELPLGERVSVPTLHAVQGRNEVFLGTADFLAPPRALRLDIAARELTPVAGPPGGAEPPPARIRRHTATSRDGTPVRYTLLRPRDAAPGPLPTLLWGYGGFDLAVTPTYRPLFAAWVAAGGAVAVANLRGGGEQGRAWHRAGMLHRKQNVFDDFTAVAGHLASTGAADRDRLVLHGRSNGGLLVGAVLTQHPELAAVALPSVGVLDLLRYHRFTIGHAWINEFGDPEDPAHFRSLRAYSPVHNTRKGTQYPATLVQTADHDDRVVPAHSYKFAAALQAAQAGDAPVLLRTYGGGGHGAGTRRSTLVAQAADALAFAAAHTGLVVPEMPEVPDGV